MQELKPLKMSDDEREHRKKELVTQKTELEAKVKQLEAQMNQNTPGQQNTPTTQSKPKLTPDSKPIAGVKYIKPREEDEEIKNLTDQVI